MALNSASLWAGKHAVTTFRCLLRRVLGTFPSWPPRSSSFVAATFLLILGGSKRQSSACVVSWRRSGRGGEWRRRGDDVGARRRWRRVVTSEFVRPPPPPPPAQISIHSAAVVALVGSRRRRRYRRRRIELDWRTEGGAKEILGRAFTSRTLSKRGSLRLVGASERPNSTHKSLLFNFKVCNKGVFIHFNCRCISLAPD